MPKKILDILPPESKISKIEETALEEDFQQPKKIKSEILKKPFSIAKNNKIKAIIISLLFLILTWALFNFRLARLEIIIWPETEALNLKETVSLELEKGMVDFDQKIIPGKILEEKTSASQQFSVSGKALKEEKAKGIIRVYNNYHLPQTLIVNTRFQPPLEKILYFRTTRTITVPAGGFLDVEVIADAPGNDYNIGPSTFSIPGLAGLPQYYSIYGKSFSPMQGGFKGQISQITQEDIDKAKNSLFEKLQREGRELLKTKVPEGFILLEEGISQEIITENFPEVGTESDSFKGELQIKSKAILFKRSDLEELAKKIILDQLPEDKKMNEESLKIDYSLKSPSSLGGKELAKIILDLDISVKIYSALDEVSLTRGLLGKSLRETQMLLADQPEIVKVKLKAFPFWLRKVPQEENKIKIKFNLD